MRHPPECGDEDRDNAEELGLETVAAEEFAQRFAGRAFDADPACRVDGHGTDDRHRADEEQHRLGEFDIIEEAQDHQRCQECHGEADEPEARAVHHIEDPVDVDPDKIREILFRLPAVARCPLDDIERNADDPVAGRGPEHGKRNPVPEVRERPHVDQLENGLIPVHSRRPPGILVL